MRPVAKRFRCSALTLNAYINQTIAVTKIKLKINIYTYIYLLTQPMRGTPFSSFFGHPLQSAKNGKTILCPS